MNNIRRSWFRAYILFPLIIIFIASNLCAQPASRGLYALDDAAHFNVLDSVAFDPSTGRIMLVGHLDTRYGGSAIPYLDYLAELLKNPSPEFTFDWTPESRSRVDALFRNFDSDTYVKRLVGQWTDIMDANGHPTGSGRWVLPLIGIKPVSHGERLGYLGARVRETTQQLKKKYERLLIVSVVPGGPADLVGLRAGDVISNYANAPLLMHRVLLSGEGGQLMLQIWRNGQDMRDLVTVTLGSGDGDPWEAIDKFDIVQKMLWAAGNEKGAMLIGSFADVNRILHTKSRAGLVTAVSILISVADFNDAHWQNVVELQAGRMSENEVNRQAWRAIFSAMENAFSFEDRPLTSTFDNATRSGLDSYDATDRVIPVLNERIGPYLEQVMKTLLAKNEEIQVPPEVMSRSIGTQVEVIPEYRGVDPHSELARLFYDADYLGKSLVNMPSLGKKIPRYQTDFAFERNNPGKAGPWHSSADYHLWYSIDNVDLARFKDNNTLFTRGAKMRINIRQKAPGGADEPAVPGGYEELLTSLYDDLALEFPVLHTLSEAAKVSAAAQWLKAKKPGLKLPEAGRAAVSMPDKAPGFVFLTISPQNRPGRLAAALSVMGGVTFNRKISSLDLVRAPKDIIGVADDGAVPVVDLSRNPGWIPNILRMPAGAPGPGAIGGISTVTQNGKEVTGVSFIPPGEKDSLVTVPVQKRGVDNAVVVWRANDLQNAEKTLAERIQQDRQRYNDQLQKLMNETGHLKVPSPARGNYIDEGIMLGLFNPKSVEQSYIGVASSFTPGKKYKEGEVFATTDAASPSEAIRGLLDNRSLGEYTLNSPYGKKLIERLEGTHFDRLIAHSNGATVAEALIRKGIITVDELNVVGGDRSLINKAGLQELIDSGKVKSVNVWTNPGDLIPQGSSFPLPTPDNPTGTIPLAATAMNIARTMTGESRGGGGTVDYRDLAGEQYIGQEWHLDKTIVDAHDLKHMYFYNIRKYFEEHKK